MTIFENKLKRWERLYNAQEKKYRAEDERVMYE
jgi:hypothetical protein